MSASLVMTNRQMRAGKFGVEEKFVIKVLACFFLALSVFCVSIYANDGQLTDIFSTKAFQGSWEVINKFNWVGWALNFIISAFCILGLFLILYSRMISLLYLSSRNLWDNVYDMKQKKGPWFGVLEMGRSVFNAEHGTGLDAFVGFFYGLLPNVKKYSDYNPEKMSGNLSEEDNAANYILKTAPSTIILIFFFTIGFSGTLAKAYGVVVDAMATAADNVVSVNLSTYVNRFFASGNNHQFSLGKDGTQEGKVQGAIAQQMYRIVISKYNILDQKGMEYVGSKVETWVANNITEAKVKGKVGQSKITDSGWKNLDYDVLYTTSNVDESHSISADMDTFVPDGKGRIQIVFKLNSASNTESPFKGAGGIK